MPWKMVFQDYLIFYMFLVLLTRDSPLSLPQAAFTHSPLLGCCATEEGHALRIAGTVPTDSASVSAWSESCLHAALALLAASLLAHRLGCASSRNACMLSGFLVLLPVLWPQSWHCLEVASHSLCPASLGSRSWHCDSRTSPTGTEFGSHHLNWDFTFYLNLRFQILKCLELSSGSTYSGL